MPNREMDKWIARQMTNKGIEMTPQEVRDTMASIAAKFRKINPDLPDDDDELLDEVIREARIDFSN